MASAPATAPQGAEAVGRFEEPEERSFAMEEVDTNAQTAQPNRTSPSQPQEWVYNPPSQATMQPPPNTVLLPPSDPLQSEPLPQVPEPLPQVPEPVHLPPPSDNAAPSSTLPAPQPSSPTRNRAQSEAIGPSTDNPNTLKADPSGSPTVLMTLLLTNGARHPYKIDEKYLRKRNVVVDGMDPFNISVYILKELIWRDWREEWEPRPSSPSSIRLIHFGRLLDDKSHLKDCRFNPSTPNVVHMTVKPQDLVDEEEAHAKSGKGSFMGRSDRGDDERTSGCRCVIL